MRIWECSFPLQLLSAGFAGMLRQYLQYPEKHQCQFVFSLFSLLCSSSVLALLVGLGGGGEGGGSPHACVSLRLELRVTHFLPNMLREHPGSDSEDLKNYATSICYCGKFSITNERFVLTICKAPISLPATIGCLLVHGETRFVNISNNFFWTLKCQPSLTA